MSLKFSRNKGRVQPTPPVCKRPPIPQPPGTPLEAMSAAFTWHGYTWTGEPLNATAICNLSPKQNPDHVLWTGATSNNLDTFTLQLTIPNAPANCFAMIALFTNGIPIGAAHVFFTPDRLQPFDSGPLALWTTLPPDTTLHMKILG